MPTTDNDTNNPPCSHCGTIERPRSSDRWDNWLCEKCANIEAEVEWDED